MLFGLFDTARVVRGFFLILVLHFFRLIRDHAFGRENEPRDTAGVLHRDTDDLGGINDLVFNEVAVLAGLSVKPEAALAFEDLFHDDGSVHAGVVGDLTGGFLKRPAHDLKTGGFITRYFDVVE